MLAIFVFDWTGDHRDLHVLTPFFPTRRSSDLGDGRRDDRDEPSFEQGGRDQHHDHEAIDRERPGKQIVLRGPARRGVTEQGHRPSHRSEEHTSELQSLMRISYAVFCLKKKKRATLNYSQ